MRPGVQDFLRVAGDEACYAIHIVRLAEVFRNCAIDLIRALEDAIDAKHLYFNWHNYNDPMNFRVDNGAAMLSALTGVRWELVHTGPEYQETSSELAIYKYARSVEVKGGTKEYTHFNTADFDSLVASQTVRYGRLVGKRLFRRRP